MAGKSDHLTLSRQHLGIRIRYRVLQYAHTQLRIITGTSSSRVLPAPRCSRRPGVPRAPVFPAPRLLRMPDAFTLQDCAISFAVSGIAEFEARVAETLVAAPFVAATAGLAS